MVTSQGFNALLKLVEEPPAHLKFIFATTEPEKVIPTIRSRTHHYPFRLMPPSVMRDLPRRSSGRSTSPSIRRCCRWSCGQAAGPPATRCPSLTSWSRARTRAASPTAGRSRCSATRTPRLLDEIVDAFTAADGAAVFRTVNRVIEGGHAPRRFATDLLDRFRDLIVVASMQQRRQRTSERHGQVRERGLRLCLPVSGPLHSRTPPHRPLLAWGSGRSAIQRRPRALGTSSAAIGSPASRSRYEAR